jgi:hypothetical protein
MEVDVGSKKYEENSYEKENVFFYNRCNYIDGTVNLEEWNRKRQGGDGIETRVGFLFPFKDCIFRNCLMMWAGLFSSHLGPKIFGPLERYPKFRR